MRFLPLLFAVLLAQSSSDEEIELRVAREAQKIREKYKNTAPDPQIPWLSAPKLTKSQVKALTDQKKTTTQQQIGNKLVEFEWIWNSNDKCWDFYGSKVLK